ncbi:hypothetical protein C1Y22_36110, partial [Pseudomonas sp. MPR-R2A5]
ETLDDRAAARVAPGEERNAVHALAPFADPGLFDAVDRAEHFADLVRLRDAGEDEVAVLVEERALLACNFAAEREARRQRQVRGGLTNEDG